MKRVFMWMAWSAFVWGNESFITMEEYGEELYKNPRGIGCIACHGESGKGKVIATYKEKGKLKVLRGPDIRNLDFKVFYERTLQDKGVMPKYHLTNDEIKAIYLYLKTRTNIPEPRTKDVQTGQVEAKSDEENAP